MQQGVGLFKNMEESAKLITFMTTNQSLPRKLWKETGRYTTPSES